MPHARLALLALLGVLTSSLVLQLVTYAGQRRTLTRWEQRLTAQSEIRAALVVDEMDAIRRESDFIAALPPIQGFIRAARNQGFDALELSTTEQWRHRLQQLFKNFVANNPEVVHVRYFMAVDTQLEYVEVERATSGPLIVVPAEHRRKDALRRLEAKHPEKFDQTVVSEMTFAALAPGGLPPGGWRLTASNGFRGSSGGLIGMTEIMIDASLILAKLAAHLPEGSRAYLMASDGSYIMREGAIMAPGRVQDRWPGWREEFVDLGGAGTPRNTLRSYRSQGETVFAVTQPIRFERANSLRQYTLALAVPRFVIDDEVAGDRNTALFIIVAGLLLVGGVTVPYLRQRARAAVEAARLAAIVNSSRDAIIGKTLDGIVTDWNPAAEFMFGYSAKAMIGHSVRAFIHPESGNPADAEVVARIRCGEAISFEGLGCRADGEAIDVAVSVSPIRTAQGVIVGASELVRDISAQKQAEQVRTRTLLQLKAFVQQAPVSVAMFDCEMRYLCYSDRWLSDYGRGRDDLTGLSHYDVHPDLPAAWHDVHRRGLAGATMRKDNDYWVQADGSRHWLRWAVLPWLTDTGGIGGIIISAEDITEQKLAEEQLRVAAVAFQSRDGMVVTDVQGVVLQANQAFIKGKGFSLGEIVGKTPAVWRSDRQDAVFYRNMWEALLRVGHWDGQVWNRRKDGGVFPEWLSISSVCDETGRVTHYVGTYSDIRAPKEAERKILDLAFYDPLTNLPNRRLMLDRLEQAASASVRNGKYSAILLFDLDHFKVINDTRGHDVGDALLVEVTRRLCKTLRQEDTAARLGGDEFIVLIEGLHAVELEAASLAEAVAQKLLAAIAQPYCIKGKTHYVTCSIGAALFGEQKAGVELLLKQADVALYQAKDAGRNTVRFFNQQMQAAVDARAALETDLRRALAQGEFEMHFQRQVDPGGRCIGAEALLRWRSADMGMQLPSVFMKVAEDSGLIVPIGSWVIWEACRQLRDWSDDAFSPPMLAVNVSAQQFCEPGFVDQVVEALHENEVDPRRLKLELTESTLLHEVDRVIDTMHRLKSLGIGISIDDFGMGYSSLSYLKRLPLDELKIDQGFVRNLVNDEKDRAIVRTILALGESLGLQVIAEGVETKAQFATLLSLRCQAFQGFFFARPSPCAKGGQPERLAKDAG